MYGLAYISTLVQDADIFAKRFTSVGHWKKAVYLIGHSYVKSSRPASPVIHLDDAAGYNDQRIAPEYAGSSLNGVMTPPHRCWEEQTSGWS